MPETLINPPVWRQIIDWIGKPSRTRKIAVYAFFGLVIIGGGLFAADRLTSWKQNRDIARKRVEINAALVNLAEAQNSIVKDKIDEAAHKQDVIDKTQDYLNAVNATDGARGETNRALQNMNSAITANRNVGITADELERRLNEINP